MGICGIKKAFGVLFIALMGAITAHAQEKLFGPGGEETHTHSGIIFNINAGLDLPMADMAKRFGMSYRLGPSLWYKTKQNWIIGIRTDFIVGGKIKDDSLMINIRDRYLGFNGKTVEMLNVDGNRVGVPFYERGYMAGIQVGKIVKKNKSNPDNGLFILGSTGFIQHRINIFVRDKDVPQLRGEYLKGYDRLTNGWYLGSTVGYSYISSTGLLNFNFAFDGVLGFTKGRREYQFDLGRENTEARTDILLGIKAAWMIPIFKRKEEEIVFE